MPPNLRIGLVQSAPNQAYYPGSTITGSLLLDVDEPKSYNEILIHFSGRSYVHWSESHTTGSRRNRRRVTRHYSSSEAYVDLVSPLWNSQQSPDGKLAPGQYSWPFSFEIPPTAPSSFEGSVGHIRYSLVGKIVTGLFKFDHNVELRVPVQQLVKISDPRLLQPVREEVQKTVCCLCCASGPIVLTVALPKTGFLLGESIQFHASLENGSNRLVTMNASIVQHIVFHAQGHRRFGGKTFVSVASDAVEPQASRNWEPTIQTPTSEVDIVHETSCGNINISYTLTVVCQIPRALNLSTAFRLQLGNCRDEDQTAADANTSAPQYANPPPSETQPPPLGDSAPPPYAPPAASVGPPPQQAATGFNIGWSTEPSSDFPPPQPQETLTDFPAQQIEKGIK